MIPSDASVPILAYHLCAIEKHKLLYVTAYEWLQYRRLSARIYHKILYRWYMITLDMVIGLVSCPERFSACKTVYTVSSAGDSTK